MFTEIRGITGPLGEVDIAVVRQLLWIGGLQQLAVSLESWRVLKWTSRPPFGTVSVKQELLLRAQGQAVLILLYTVLNCKSKKGIVTMGKDTFELGGREWPKVTWWNMKGMRFVYLTLWAAMITSATNGIS